MNYLERGEFDCLIREQICRVASRCAASIGLHGEKEKKDIYSATKAQRKLRNPINAVKGEIDGETTGFRGATDRFGDLVADRSSGRKPVKLYSWDQRLHYERPNSRACSHD